MGQPASQTTKVAGDHRYWGLVVMSDEKEKLGLAGRREKREEKITSLVVDVAATASD